MTAAEIARALGGRHYGGGWICRCPAHDDGRPSLSLKDSPTTGKLLVTCFAGCEGRDIVAALRHKGLLPGNCEGYVPPKPDLKAEEEERRRKEASLRVARKIWAEAKPAEGTPVETYLHARGYDGPIPQTLRYHPALKHSSGPNVWIHGMVGVILREGTPLITGIHRTFLSPQGTWKTDKFPDKAMLGEAIGGAIRLGCYAAERLAIAEGIETGLSVMAATGLPTWAAMTAGGIAALVLPPLPLARDILIAADHDAPNKQHPEGHGLEAAKRAKARWEAEGRTVVIKIPAIEGQDFNDVLRARAKKAMAL